MGKTLRPKRIPNVLSITVTQIGREASGRAYTRGLLLLVILFCASVSALSQTPLDTRGIPADVDERLRRELNGSTEQKRSALFEIRNIRSPAASLIAVPTLNDREEVVRATAAGSVVFLPRADAVRVLTPLLSDKADFVRREAATALGTVGDTSASAALVRLMRSDKVLEVRTAAAVALGMAGDGTVVDSLLKILQTKPREDDEFLRRSAARSIGQIAQRMASIEPQLVTPQNFLPEKFKDAGPENVPALPGFARAVPMLMDVLKNRGESDDTKREAAFALGAIGDSRAVTLLRSHAGSADPYLAEIVREALLTIERRNKSTALPDNK